MPAAKDGIFAELVTPVDGGGTLAPLVGSTPRRRRRQRRALTAEEIRQIGAGQGAVRAAKSAAAVARIATGTIRRRTSEGWYPDSAIRGKPLRFHRDRFIVEEFGR